MKTGHHSNPTFKTRRNTKPSNVSLPLNTNLWSQPSVIAVTVIYRNWSNNSNPSTESWKRKMSILGKMYMIRAEITVIWPPSLYRLPNNRFTVSLRRMMTTPSRIFTRQAPITQRLTTLNRYTANWNLNLRISIINLKTSNLFIGKLKVLSQDIRQLAIPSLVIKQLVMSNLTIKQ